MSLLEEGQGVLTSSEIGPQKLGSWTGERDPMIRCRAERETTPETLEDASEESISVALL